MAQAVYQDKDGEMYHEACTTEEDRKSMIPVTTAVIDGDCDECGNALGGDPDLIEDDENEDDDNEDDEEEDD